MYSFIVPFLSPSPHVPGCYVHAVRLLASLSGFQVTRKCWKDEVMELFMDSKFFIMEEACIHEYVNDVIELFFSFFSLFLVICVI